MIIQALNALGINCNFCVDADVTTEEHYLRTYRDFTDQNRFFEWSVVWAKNAGTSSSRTDAIIKRTA